MSTWWVLGCTPSSLVGTAGQEGDGAQGGSGGRAAWRALALRSSGLPRLSVRNRTVVSIGAAKWRCRAWPRVPIPDKPAACQAAPEAGERGPEGSEAPRPRVRSSSAQRLGPPSVPVTAAVQRGLQAADAGTIAALGEARCGRRPPAPQ